MLGNRFDDKILVIVIVKTLGRIKNLELKIKRVSSLR